MQTDIDIYRKTKNMIAKPFVKWAGGKGNLLHQLDALLPADYDLQKKVTYIELFVGGGAMLFHMLLNHPCIRRAVINDINADLIRCHQQTCFFFPQNKREGYLNHLHYEL